MPNIIQQDVGLTWAVMRMVSRCLKEASKSEGSWYHKGCMMGMPEWAHCANNVYLARDSLLRLIPEKRNLGHQKGSIW